MDASTNDLTLNFSEPVQSAGMASGIITAAGSGSGSRMNTVVGAFNATSARVFVTAGGVLTGSNAVVSATSGISALVSVSSGLPVAAFGGLVVPRVS